MRLLRLTTALIVVLVLGAAWVAGCTVADNAEPQTRGTGSITGVTGTFSGNLNANGGFDVDDVFVVKNSTGQLVISGTADSDAANYDNMILVDHDLIGLGTKDRVYGVDIEMTRPAGYGTSNGDHDDAGLKIRMINKAVTNTVGTVLRGVDVNVKNDNPSGSITMLSGATFTAQTDTGSPPAGNVSTAYAVQGQITANAPVTDSLIVADFRNFRQTATEPTIEYGVQIRNGNTTGTGIDRGLSFASEAATVGAFGYGIDMNDAEVTTADIRLSQGETIANTTDGTISLGGAVSISGATTLAGLNKITAGTSVTVTNGAAFALAATFQPITAAGEVTPTITIPAAGVYACIYNTSAQTVNIADTGNQVLSAAWAGTQYDTLCGYSDGTRFIEISRSTN